MNSRGYRVIAFGKAPVNAENTIENVRVIGFAGLIDPADQNARNGHSPCTPPASKLS